MPEAKHHRLIIVGSGPAGFTAGIYASRANLSPVMIEGIPREYELPGGQLMITTDVENYPGFPKGIQGPELMELFREQAVRFGTEVVSDFVSKFDLSKRPFRLDTEGGLAFTCDALIIATGAQAKWLGIPSETKLRGYGVSACATCDGAFFKNKTVMIVGGGDTAMEEAHFLTHHAAKVIVVHRREEFRASKIMQERVKKNPKVSIIWNAEVEEILGEPGHGAGGVKGVILHDVKTKEKRQVAIDGIFIAIGHKPNTDVLGGQLKVDETGYIITQGGTTTTVEGVFAAGDVADKIYRQAVTAAGTGCMAAIDAERYLSARSHA